MTVSIGNSLREEREAKGISIDEVAASTRISKRYISAIEADNFDILPSEIFIKGFIRSYCEFLGVDGEIYIRRFVEEKQKKRETDDAKIMPEKTANEKEEREWLFALRLFGVAGAVFLIGIALIIWRLSFASHNNAEVKENFADTTGAMVYPNSLKNIVADEFSTVKIKADSNAQVYVEANQTVYLDRTLLKGEEREYTVGKNFRLKTEPKVFIYLDGKCIFQPIEGAQNILRLQINNGKIEYDYGPVEH